MSNNIDLKENEEMSLKELILKIQNGQIWYILKLMNICFLVMKTSLNLYGKTWGKRLRNEKMENEEIWLKPPVSEITESLESELEKRPEEVSVNVILTGIGAARYHFSKSLLRSAYPNLEERDIDKYLVRAGAEREIERLAYLWKMVQNDNGEQS